MVLGQLPQREIAPNPKNNPNPNPNHNANRGAFSSRAIVRTPIKMLAGNPKQSPNSLLRK